MADEWGDPIEPVEERSPLGRSFLRLLPNSLLALWLGEPADQRRAFESKLEDIEDELDSLNEELANVLAGDRHLTTSDRRAFQEYVQAVVDQYDAIRTTTWPFPYSNEDLGRLGRIRSELRSARHRIEEYNSDFVEKELERYEDLFTNVDEEGNDLNEDQRKAVVRDDEYNQVIAGAGTGKTLTLTHRIAYLIERGVEPDRIAAITLTNNATDEIQTRLEERFDVTDVEVDTIHAFANGIACEARSSHADTIDKQQRKNIVEEVIREKTTEDSTDFAWHYRQFLAYYQTEVPDLDAYDSREEYVRAGYDHRTSGDVPMSGDGTRRERVALVHEAGEDYDPHYYETQLVRAVESILSPLGWEGKDIARYLSDARDALIISY